MRKRTFILFVLYILLSAQINAQDGNFKIKIKSIRLDLTSLLFINDATGLMNIEFFEISKNSYGIEPSISYVTAGNPGGSEYASPFRDYNMMFYSILKTGRPTALKFTFGYTHRTSIATYVSDFSDEQLKLGVSFYWDVLKYFGMCIRFTNAVRSSKYSASGIGIGFSFNWTQ